MALPLDVPESAQPRAVKAVKRMRVGLLSIVGQGAEKNSEFLIAQSAPDESDPVLTICQEAYDAFDTASNDTARHNVVDEFSAKLRNLIEPTVAQSEDGADVTALKARLGGWELHQGFREHLDTTVHSPADAEEALLDLHNVMREEIGLEPLAISTGDAMETEEIAQSQGAGVGKPKKEELHDATSATDVEGADGAGGEAPESVESECPHCGSKTGGSAAIRKGKSGSGNAEAKGKAAMSVAQDAETPDEEAAEEVAEETTEEAASTEESTEESAEEETPEEEAAEEEAEFLEAPRAARKEDADGVVAQHRLPPSEAKWANVFGQNPHTAQLVAQAAEEYEGVSVIPETDSANPDIAAIVAQAVEQAVAATTERFESRLAELTSRKATPAKSRQVDAEPAAPTVAQSTEKSVWQDGPLRGLFG